MLLAMFALSGCLPLLAGGIIGYEVNEYYDHQEWMRRQQEELERLRWEAYTERLYYERKRAERGLD